MDGERRQELAREALEGYASGPGAPVEATNAALARADEARSLILVEGISDQIAVETLAGRLGRDLGAEGVVVVPIGGAQAIGAYLSRFGPHGADISLRGLCDAGEENYFRRALGAAGIGSPASRGEMEQLGFFVCVEDLEDELIRASGVRAIEALLDSQGDLGSFRTLQRQPAWRSQQFEAQMRRFLGAGSRRKLRYAHLLVQSLQADRIPNPLNAVLGGDSVTA